MFNFICKNFPHLMPSTRASQTRNFYFLQSNPFSTSSRKALKSSSRSNDESVLSFRCNYLIKTFGFPPERAASASKYMNFETPEKPDSVILFLENQGFTNSQISRMAIRFPPFLLSDPEKSLLPKIEFFRLLGFPDTEITETLCARPHIFRRSLEKQLRPCFEFVKGLLPSDVKTLGHLKGYSPILCCDLETCLIPNVEILREFGVPDENIVAFLKIQTRTFPVNATKFRKIVEEVKEMGCSPLRLNFGLAIHVFTAMKKSTWEMKVEIYKKWGWSEDEIHKAFGKQPRCMLVSGDKITRTMDFLVNKMGFNPSFILKAPAIVSLSLQKRIIPRCIVYQALSAKRLMPKVNSKARMLVVSDKEFLKKYVEPFEADVPELLTLYQKNLHFSS